MWLRIRMKKTPNPQNPFHFVYPRILVYNFLKMKTNSYSVNVSQCIHVKQCFLLLKLKHTYCPEMPTIFYKRELSTAQNYSKGPLWSCSVLLAVADMNWIPATKSKFGFKFTAVSLCWTRFTLQVYNPLHFCRTVIWILKYCIGTKQILWSWYSIFKVLTACFRGHVGISGLERGRTVT